MLGMQHAGGSPGPDRVWKLEARPPEREEAKQSSATVGRLLQQSRQAAQYLSAINVGNDASRSFPLVFNSCICRTAPDRRFSLATAVNFHTMLD